MTITPEKADRLKQDATDGPWELDEHDVIMNGRVFRLRQQGKPGIRVSATVYGHNGDPELIAAAPDMAQTVIEQAKRVEELEAQLAGMTWQTGVHAGDEYIWAETPEEEAIAVVAAKSPEVRLVRRLVSDPEVIDGE